MSTEIIVAILALAGTLAGSYMGVRQVNSLVNHRMNEVEKGQEASKVTLSDLVTKTELNGAEIKHLQDKMDKHNNLVEKVTVLGRDRDTLFKYKDNHENRIQKLEDAS
ncbi:hypothetical protein LJC74_01640 [Eubacteriales bacterium OttesenSCG-928-A19]|nr:hypothetical protein [Eubacteriales bacterium OttesenSCG-928-A19]